MLSVQMTIILLHVNIFIFIPIYPAVSAWRKASKLIEKIHPFKKIIITKQTTI
jgi:hypothetical protein